MYYLTLGTHHPDSSEAAQALADEYFRAYRAPGLFRVQPFAFSMGIALQAAAYNGGGQKPCSLCDDDQARTRIRRLLIDRIQMGPWQNSHEAFGLACALMNCDCLLDLAEFIAIRGAERWPADDRFGPLCAQIRERLHTRAVNAREAETAPINSAADTVGAAQSKPVEP